VQVKLLVRLAHLMYRPPAVQTGPVCPPYGQDPHWGTHFSGGQGWLAQPLEDGQVEI
jgi:hypothetical protein